jgi:DNA replication protein DnaC
MEEAALVKMFNIPNAKDHCADCKAKLGLNPEDAYDYKGRILCPRCYRKAQSDFIKASGTSLLNAAIESIPPRFRDCTFKNFIPMAGEGDGIINLAKLKQIRECAIAGKSIVLFGDNGLGKTHLMYSILKVVVYNGKTARICPAFDYYDEIKEAWRMKKDPKKVLIDYKTPDCLLLDEIDKKFGTDNEELQLYRLINERYLERKQTIITLNGDPNHIEAIVGKSTYDRLCQDGEAFYFKGKSFRRLKK